MLPPGTILLPVPQYVFVPVPRIYILPVLQNIPNFNNHTFTMQQATPLFRVNVPNPDMNLHHCNTMQINTSYPITTNTNNPSLTEGNDIPVELSSDDDDDIIFDLSDSDSHVVELDSIDSEMNISSVIDDNNDGLYVYDDNDDGDDHYVDDDDDDEESITGAYWL